MTKEAEMKGLKLATILFALLIFSTTAFAYFLSEYPSPFVENGLPAPNLVVVVGDDSAASDVLGAVDIALSLQTAASTVSGQQTDEEKIVPSASIPIGTQRHMLAINDYLGNVREAFSETDSDLLKGGKIMTPLGATVYRQYLRFGNESGQIIFDRDKQGIVDTYLTFPASMQMFEWQLQFERGLVSQVSGTELSDLNDKEIQILGQPMVIVDTDYTDSTGRLMIKLMGGAIAPIMSEGDKQTYKVNGQPYYVEVLVLSTTSNNGQGSVKFRINGEITDELARGSITTLADGTSIGVRSILPSSKDTQKSIVQFYLGANYIVLEDRRISDNVGTTAGVTVNGNTVPTATVRIDGKVIVANKTISIDNIFYDLNAEPLFGELYIPGGKGLRNYLKTPEGMLVPDWDIFFNGLTQTGETKITLKPVSDQKYDLEFANQEGIQYQMPLLIAQNNCLKYGDETSNLWFIESNSPTIHYAKLGDYFVLSKCNAAANKNTCNTHIVKYKSTDTSGMSSGELRLYFTDIGTGDKDVSLSRNGADFAGILSAGDGQYAVHANSVMNYDGSINISIDVNGDNAFNNGEAVIGTKGQALIDLGTTNTNESNQEGRNTFVCSNPAITLRTLSKQFEKASGDEVIPITIEQRASNTIGITTPITATSGYFSGLKIPKPRYWEGMTGYGAFFDVYDAGTNRAERTTIRYPLRQRGAELNIGKQQASADIIKKIADETQTTQAGTATTVMQSIAQTRLTNLVKFSSEIDNIQDYNSVLIGGACVNPIVAQLQENPQPCWESIAKGVAVIRAVPFSNGNIALVVAGRNAADTRRATTALARGLLKNIKGLTARATEGPNKGIIVVSV